MADGHIFAKNVASNATNHTRGPNSDNTKAELKKNKKTQNWIGGEKDVIAASLHITTMEGTPTWMTTSRCTRTSYA